MRIKVQDLKHALELVGPAVARKATLPITQDVLVQGRRLTAYDLELAVVATLPNDPSLAEPEDQDFTCTLPYKQLTDMLRHVPGSAVAQLEAQDGAVLVTAGPDRLRLPGHDPLEFPPLPQAPGEGEPVDGDRFIKGLLGALPYTATDKSRPVLEGVCVTLGDSIQMAGADGFRLAWQELGIKLRGSDGTGPRFVVPGHAVSALARVWGKALKSPAAGSPASVKPDSSPNLDLARNAVAKRMMQVQTSPDWCGFQFGEATVLVHLLQGKFPDYQTLIPADPPKKLAFDAQAAHRAVRMLAPVADADKGIIRLEWDGAQTMRMSAFSGNSGEAYTAIQVRAHGGEGKIAFHAKYLAEYLASKYGPVLLECATPSNPGRFTHEGSPGVIIMPMFVAWEGEPVPAAAEAAAPDQTSPEEVDETEDQTGPDEPVAPPEAARAPRRGGRRAAQK